MPRFDMVLRLETIDKRHNLYLSKTTLGIIVHGHYTMKWCLLMMLQLLMVCNPTIPRISFNMTEAEEADNRIVGNHELDFGFTGKQKR